MPAAYSRTATQALTNVTYRYIELLADHGFPGALAKDRNLVGGVNLFDGKVTCKGVADAHGMDFHAPSVLGW
jgi:alanine dehydrogenase